ncbi:PQQ-binding-like beta-propeller repeat protein [Jiangella asiatica]|uniref:Uncharacterized protein n=1 Tax=Jiangella asiatica TaxID=2530372 RepID=A0A4R5DBX6_9ACTN|nr:PQQ-binding-like beta-propeller repeat protein [Jiangella asiatica]TDE11189.1 hypothetical protein E1269_09965 [Jiangella asiatica]
MPQDQRHDDWTPFGRRAFIYAGASIAAAAATGAAPAWAGTRLVSTGEAAATGTTTAAGMTAGEDLGIAMRSVNVRTGAVGRLDGRPVIYVVSNGIPAIFNVIDAQTGALITAHEITNHESSFALKIAPDESVYFEGRPGGRLFRYLPAEDRLVDLGQVTEDAYRIPSIAVDEDGVVYGGTNPDGHAFAFDPSTGEFTDYGPIAEGETFCRLGAVGDGLLYAGTSPNGRLFAIDLATGTKSEIPLPEPYASSESAATPRAWVQGLLFVFVSPSRAALVYDTRTGQWADDLPRYGGDAGPTEQLRTAVFAEDLDSRNLWEYDLVARRATLTDFNTGRLGTTTRVIGHTTLAGRGFPGLTLVGMGVTGRMWHWNPITGEQRWIDSEVQGSPVPIRATGGGPDGNVYVGPFFSSGVMARYIVAEERFEQLDGPTQVEAFGIHDGKLYLGTYTGAGIAEFDPVQPWDYGRNPRQLFNLDGYGQERPWGLASVGDRLAIGTTAPVGSLDGALSFYTPATGELNVIGTLFEGHGVPSLAAHGLLLAGGTSTRVSSTPPTAPAARLFLWDAAADRLLWDGVPFEDAKDIGHLFFADDGRLWGVTNNARVFEFDVDSRQVLRSAVVRPGADANTGFPALFAAPDGGTYGSTGDGDLFRVDPATMAIEIIDTEAGPATLGPDGNIYYAKNEISLYRLRL